MDGLARQAEELEQLRRSGNPGFFAALQSFYAPFELLPRRLRSGDPEAIGPALVFLETDPWCFRSGYMKADLMRALANGPDIGRHRLRVQAIILHRLRHPEPGLKKPTVRLAARVWDSGLDSSLTAAVAADPLLEPAVEALRIGVLQQHNTDAGASSDLLT